MKIIPNSTFVEVICSSGGRKRMASWGGVREGGVAGGGGSGEGGGGSWVFR